MTKDEMFTAIVGQRRQLADTLDGCSEAEWNGPIAPLTDLVVHRRDIERPLGRPSHIDPAVQTAVLNFLCGGRAFGFAPPKRTKGLRFEATDMNWSIGAGPKVSGPAEAIMMAVSDRGVALQDLSGDGVEALAGRLGS
jgi:hypothetical protein